MLSFSRRGLRGFVPVFIQCRLRKSSFAPYQITLLEECSLYVFACSYHTGRGEENVFTQSKRADRWEESFTDYKTTLSRSERGGD